MTAIQCAHCSRPVPDRLPLCQACGDSVVVELLAIPGLVVDLTITRIGAARFGARDGGRSADTPLPVRVTGTRGIELVGERAYTRLETAVTGWARVLAETMHAVIPIGVNSLVVMVYSARERTHAPRSALPFILATPLEQAAVWMASHPHEIRAHEGAGELAADIIGGTEGIRRVVDRPTELRYLGACATVLENGEPCAAALRAEVGADWVRCRRCRVQYEVRKLEADARAAVENELYPLADMARILTGLGAPVQRTTLYMWAQRRRIEPHGWQHVDERGVRITDHRVAEADVQVYRVGDALKRAERDRNEGGSAA